MIVLPLLAIACLGYGGYLAQLQQRMQSWPRTSATVLRFKPGVQPSGEHAWYANPSALFEYTVDGRRYRAESLNPSPFNYQSRHAFTRDTGHLNTGGVAPCWYNPADPGHAYLVNRGVTAGPIVLLVSGTVCGLVFTAAAVNRLRRRARFG
jgi:hypothetical protein